MKLVSVYIEHFGGLSQYSLSFEEGLTVINQPNGFGKTTLAEFIRAMFYGFPRKAKTLDKSRRQKYTPWSGGKCGGHLTFELDGKRYRMERTFGATPKGDSFTLIDLETNRRSSRFSEEIGLELFGLDSDSFERSTYMPQLHDTASLTTNSIQAKLSNLVEDTNDINNYDKAMEALRSKRSTLIPYRGAGGSVANAQSRISALQSEAEHCRSQSDALEGLEQNVRVWEQELESDQKNLETLRKNIVAASAAAASAAAKQQYARMESQQHQLQAKAEALEELVMTPELLEELSEKHRQRLKKQHELELLNREEESGDYDALAEQFASGVPGEEFFAAAQQYLARIGSLQQEKLVLSAPRLEEPAPQKQSPIPAVLMMLLGIGTVAAGIVMLVQSLFLAGGLALAGGIGLLAAAGFLGVQQMVSRERKTRQETTSEQLRLAAIDREIIALEQAARQLLQPYTDRTDKLFETLEQLRRDAATYQRLFEQREIRRRKARTLTDEMEALDALLCSYLGSESPEDALLRRKMAREQHRELCERRDNLAAEMIRFRQEHEAQLASVDTAQGLDLARLQQQERQLTGRITALTGQILASRQHLQELRAEADQVPELLEELEHWQLTRAEGQKNARLLDETMAFLQGAKENLQNSFLGPIRTSFDGYMKKLLGEDREKILVTPELGVQLERFGQSRELGYFSAGQVDAVMLCMRFALVDALFSNVKPFVILDDPFVNLDDRHLAEAIDLLREFAKERQILYLVCHSSRSI